MRVIAGKFGSRPLKAVAGDNTRPTTDKIKEAMFNLLGSSLPIGGVCLDFYAGSGALGIEAVSRGLNHAVLCETYRPAIKVIEKNIQMTQEGEKFTLLEGQNRRKLAQYLQAEPIIFDLVFLDPPYKKAQIKADLEWLEAQKCLSSEALIMIETDQDVDFNQLPEEFKLLKEKEYGMTSLRLYKKEEGDE